LDLVEASSCISPTEFPSVSVLAIIFSEVRKTILRLILVFKFPAGIYHGP
jgi:hypothetical protein